MTVYLILDTNFNIIMTKKVPLFLFCDKKVPRVLFENYEIHPPTLWVFLGMCSIKKVPAPPPPPPRVPTIVCLNNTIFPYKFSASMHGKRVYSSGDHPFQEMPLRLIMVGGRNACFN